MELHFINPDSDSVAGAWSLEISHNYLNSIPSLAFSGLERSLWCLILSHNQFTRIPSDSIARLEKLNHLDLSGQSHCHYHGLCECKMQKFGIIDNCLIVWCSLQLLTRWLNANVGHESLNYCFSSEYDQALATLSRRVEDVKWLRFINSLFVLDNYISDIEQFDLKSLSSSLETLILAGNSLTSVPEGRNLNRK